MRLIRSTGVQGLAAAVLLHGVGLAAVFSASPPSPDALRRRPPVRIRVAKRPEPPPPAIEKKEPRPKPEPEPRPKPEPTPKSKPKPKLRPNPEPLPEPETRAEPRAEPQPEPAPKPRKFTVSMEATVASGGVAVPASSGGTWAAGTPDGDPDGEKVLPGGQAPVQASETSVLPRLVSQPGAEEMRAAYPARARADGIEGNVSLKILVTADGRIGRVRIVRGAGHGFDQVAVDLVRRFGFRPGEKNGKPVDVWIPWTYKFRLDG